MNRRIVFLFRASEGAAAVEMAMVLPLLLLLLFSAVEAGNFFLSEHVVQKGVRDAARYASRVPLSQLTDPGCALASDAIQQNRIQELARTGVADGTGPLRLRAWDSNISVKVSIACDTSGIYAGVFSDFPDGAPVVTVSASVPYPALFNFLPFASGGRTLNATSQAAVFGA